MKSRDRLIIISAFVIAASFVTSCNQSKSSANLRERISINEGWSFMKYDSIQMSDKLIYDVRPEPSEFKDSKDADSKPTEAVEVESKQMVLKPWILPTANPFIKDKANHFIQPESNPGGDFPLVQNDFDDSAWRKLDLPHDWGIEGSFQEGWDSEVGGGMGRLPNHGVAWYRKKLEIKEADRGKSIFLDIDGAMSYAIVWLNGKLIGGWPYGYNSWRLDLTSHLKEGVDNQLAIRIENPPKSARWYPGGGLYRNVWLVKTNKVHVAHWGTFINTTDVSKASATINISVKIDNDSDKEQVVEAVTKIFILDENLKVKGDAVATFPALKSTIIAGENSTVEGSVILDSPLLWGPPPTQKPNLYLAITTLYKDGMPIDQYNTRFGIRDLEFNADRGILVNGERIQIKGVNQHHDLGALGAAFNYRAAERQLEILKEMGCNAIRMAHNPPAPELLELTDKMGFLVVDEIFDVWERKKTPYDFHLIFSEWYEADTRSFVRRDRNCPSVIMWSYGNEVGEQYTDKEGAAIAKKLVDIIKDEDPTRPTTASMNWAKSDMPFPTVMDLISFNYQGEGIRQDPIFDEVKDRIKTKPQYIPFHEKFPDKVILSSETASALSTRGTYLFPVTDKLSSPVRDGMGGDPESLHVSSYELYAVDFGSSADKVFGAIAKHPFVAGEFVWTGWDYLGEPTPYYLCRSSYSGIIDLAGFKKDRFYLYQAHWRPEQPMVHILPHWNWPERIGEITPVHVITSGDVVELFLNNKSLGTKEKGEFEYRLRWDDVKYEPGELKAVAYKKGKFWAEKILKTTGKPEKLFAEADRSVIKADGKDLSFLTIKVIDQNGLFVPTANNIVEYSIEGPGEIVATDNGDPSNMRSFQSKKREIFNGLGLVIVRSKKDECGVIKIMVKSNGLTETVVEIESK